MVWMNCFRDEKLRKLWDLAVADSKERHRKVAMRAQAGAANARYVARVSRETAASTKDVEFAAKALAHAKKAEAAADACDKIYARAYAASVRYVPSLPPILPELLGWGSMIRETMQRNAEGDDVMHHGRRGRSNIVDQSKKNS